MASLYKKKPKVFILGLSGFIGHALARHLREKFTVTGCYFSNPVHLHDVHAFPVSLKNDTDMLERLLSIQAPDFAISAIGINDLKKIATNEKIAETINLTVPLSFALMAGRNRAKHIFISCGEIFDGQKGNYDENSKDISAIGNFSKAKSTADIYIRAQTTEGTTLRVGKVVGLGHHYRHSFLDELRARLQSEKPYYADENKFNSYISTISLAKAVEEILLNPFPANKQRIFHLGGPRASEMEIATILSLACGLNTKYLKPNPNSEQKVDLTLNSALMESSFQWKAESREQLIENVLSEMKPGLNSPSKHLKIEKKNSAHSPSTSPVRKPKRPSGPPTR